MRISSIFRNLAEASSDLPTALKKLSKPSMVSFVICRNLKSFAESEQGKQITKIIDVGANEGQFAFMARYSWPNAQIDCFEPDPSAFYGLKKNHGSDQRISFHNCALGSQQTELSLNLGETSAQNSILQEKGKNGQGTIIVPVETLDRIYSSLPSGVTLLKIDVQGYELEVLKGAKNLLSQIKFVLLEISLADLFEGGVEIDVIWQFIRNNGYKYHSIIDQYRDPKTQRILQMDVIFERKG
ncbi:MAG: FkbM family methyltransferase [Microcystis aeruginosa LG13-03]|uniref:2-O-methyltransferase NoeI n=1 Tax=Microcystis aeruginosa NIES-2521 TaxID=2303983 RepID=A0A5A5S197_MICAE|nr:FkbM family methyltransferase [Microcystis aeruginosa]NCQ91761.1 FkbM family methyltransferase [Microcystis aeruginosa LG13-13]NCR04945.1 FkbM family methyltransferase [Microcystis aeruginosa LG13-03]NCR63196.1 FkbM family methyltransferase [Microcystis aeruginosa LG11-05]GCA80679.1 2-O-methyltransferase NoeI [Microcystis aeruginosa NIES-2521]